MSKIDFIDSSSWSDAIFIEHYYREFQVWLAAKRASDHKSILRTLIEDGQELDIDADIASQPDSQEKA